MLQAEERLAQSQVGVAHQEHLDWTGLERLLEEKCQKFTRMERTEFHETFLATVFEPIKRGEFHETQSGTLTASRCNLLAHHIALELEYLKQDASLVG